MSQFQNSSPRLPQPTSAIAAGLWLSSKRKLEKNCFTLSRVGLSLSPLCNPGKHKIYASEFFDCIKCRSMLLNLIWILVFCSCKLMVQPPFFLLNRVEPIFPLTLVVALHCSLACIVRYRLPGDCLQTLSLFSIFHLPWTNHPYQGPFFPSFFLIIVWSCTMYLGGLL